jgi:hypothetical protein
VSFQQIAASSPEGAQRIPGNQVWPSIIISRIPPLLGLHPGYDFCFYMYKRDRISVGLNEVDMLSRLFPILLAVTGLIFLPGCANSLQVTYYSNPPGAVLYQGQQRFGYTPQTLT